MVDYNVSSIVKMEDLEHIRSRPGMYIGDSSHTTKLLIECLDNSLDEVQGGFADKIKICIDTKENIYTLMDNGRGIPHDPKLNLKDDGPVKICTQLFTSGKFNKDKEDSVYTKAGGLHGVGLTCVNALSDYVEISIIKGNSKSVYRFNSGDKKKPVERSTSKLSESDKKEKWATKIEYKPSAQYFTNLNITNDILVERLELASANFDGLEIILDIDGEVQTIKFNLESLIKKYLSDSFFNKFLIDLNLKNKFKFNDGKTSNSEETCNIKLSWDFDDLTTKAQVFTTVNLIKVETGAHLNILINSIKKVFQKLAKKYKFEFEETDPLNWLRIYVNLNIIDPHFESQTKEKLSPKSKLDILNTLDDDIEKFIKKSLDDDTISELLERFQTYRLSIKNKKALKSIDGKKRGFSKLTKLVECKSQNGEIVIGEGDSAIKSSLLQVRDSNIHALLPLRGVPPNAIDKKTSELLENSEIKEIVSALGCGIYPNCNIENLRYAKILLAADADPAGDHITCLLIGLFAKLMPEVIKAGRLFVCITPFYATGYGDSIKPLWTQKEIVEAKKKNKGLRRFKGLGQFNPEELYKFILDPTIRRIVKVKWDEKYKDSLFKLLSNADERKKLSNGTWELTDSTL